MSSAHDPPTALPPEVSGAPSMAILSREDLADIVSRAGDRSADRVVAGLETMEHKLDSHVSSVDQRLTRVDARLDEIEVRQSSNSFSSSTNVHAAPHTLPLRGSVTTPATPSRPRAGMSSAEGDWNNLSLEERMVAVIATAFTGPAARWHATLTTETVEKHRSVADIFRAMRKAFPINRGQVRVRQAKYAAYRLLVGVERTATRDRIG
ncbi:unnamed protein product [Tilletia caries]|nr:unnamed protein product [Tilletia caries]CAD7063372.1 unnamed protein product [Tilletia caries]